MIKNISLLAFLLLSNLGFSQSFSGLTEDNYSGVHGILENPAMIADSRHKFDFNLTSISSFSENDYASLNILDLGKPNFSFDSHVVKSTSENNGLFSNTEVFGPSFMASINEEMSFAVSTRARSYTNGRDINFNTFDIARKGFDYTSDLDFNEGFMDITSHTWSEIGITFSSVVFQQEEHFIKAGITAKYLQGNAIGSFQTENLVVDYDSFDSNTQGEPSLTSTGQISYTYSEVFNDIENVQLDDFGFLTSSNTGFGLDIGAIYEWKPSNKKCAANDNTKIVKNNRGENKYLLRASLAITDIGSIKYKNGLSEAYNLNKTVTKDSFDESLTISENLDNIFEKTSSDKSFTVKLPTTLRAHVDAKVNEKLYVNLKVNTSLASNSGIGNRTPTSYILTPRVQTKLTTAYFPIGYYEHAGFQSGFAARLGFIHIGSNTIITNILSESKAFNAYIGLKIPLAHRRFHKKQ